MLRDPKGLRSISVRIPRPTGEAERPDDVSEPKFAEFHRQRGHEIIYLLSANLLLYGSTRGIGLDCLQSDYIWVEIRDLSLLVTLQLGLSEHITTVRKPSE